MLTNTKAIVDYVVDEIILENAQRFISSLGNN